MSRFRGSGSVVAALVLAVTLIGCTDADDLDGGNYTFTIVPDAINASSYECVLMDFGTVRLVPLDPDAADALGASPQIAVVPSRLSFVGVTGGDQPCSGFVPQGLPEIPLPSGQYVFDQLSFGSFFFYDGVTEVSCPFDVNLLESAASPLIEIGPGNSNVIRITLDVEALAVDAFDNFCINFFFEPLSFVTIEAS